MAGIVGYTIGFCEHGNVNADLSTDLNALTEAVTQLDVYELPAAWQPFTGKYSIDRMPGSNRWTGPMRMLGTFYDDFYNRIHLNPARLDLGTVANNVTRTISVWNAYTRQSVTLNDVLVVNGAGISVDGPATPATFTPLREQFWDVTITPNGPPQIDAQLLFDFTDVADPLPVVIIGTRAVVLPAIPEVPVRERWRWLTDAQVAVDGSEQRIGLRKVPRRSLSTDLVFEDEQEVRDQYKTLLSARGRLFIPYFQYATTITAAAVAGDSVLAFDTGPVDLRDDDYVLLLMGDTTKLVQLATIGSTTATTKAPLDDNIPKGTKVVAIYASILPNNLTLQRIAANGYGTMSLNSDATYPRSSFQRPGSTATMTQLDGYNILERRPLANEGVGHIFDTGQEVLDAGTGLFEVFSDWDFTKVNTDLEFLAQRVGWFGCDHRSGVAEMDYWRLFFDRMCGSLNNFLLSTHRNDQVPAAPVGVGADSMILAGGSYVDDFWPALAYHYIAINTAAGTHYAHVTGASKDVGGDSVINFTPALPSATGWEQVQSLSYLLKQRIVNDEVELEHHAFQTYIRFKTRTVAE